MCYNGDKILYILPDFLLSFAKSLPRNTIYVYVDASSYYTIDYGNSRIKKNQDSAVKQIHMGCKYWHLYISWISKYGIKREIFVAELN